MSVLGQRLNLYQLHHRPPSIDLQGQAKVAVAITTINPRNVDTEE
ncbi:hypothetical protein [Halomonas halocynthiae]|nr:hypothetical protein [Halomonas halocynthiae]